MSRCLYDFCNSGLSWFVLTLLHCAFRILVTCQILLRRHQEFFRSEGYTSISLLIFLLHCQVGYFCYLLIEKRLVDECTTDSSTLQDLLTNLTWVWFLSIIWAVYGQVLISGSVCRVDWPPKRRGRWSGRSKLLVPLALCHSHQWVGRLSGSCDRGWMKMTPIAQTTKRALQHSIASVLTRPLNSFVALGYQAMNSRLLSLKQIPVTGRDCKVILCICLETRVTSLLSIIEVARTVNRLKMFMWDLINSILRRMVSVCGDHNVIERLVLSY